MTFLGPEELKDTDELDDFFVTVSTVRCAQGVLSKRGRVSLEEQQGIVQMQLFIYLVSRGVLKI